MKTGKIFSFIFILSAFAVNGQIRQPHSLYFMETIPQVSQMNPAIQPRANGYVMLPNVNFDFCLDFALKDMLQKHGEKWDMPLEENYDYNDLRKSIGKKVTMINAELDLDILGFGFRTGNSYWRLSVSEHITGNFGLPSDLFKITENGLPDGTKLDFSPMRIHALAYLQFNIGYSAILNDKLSIGVNVKPMFGQAASTNKFNKFGMNANENKWYADEKIDVYSSSFIENVELDEDGKIEKVNIIKFDDYSTKDWINFAIGANPGVALDLGAVYKIDERFTVSASFNNLGFISWKRNLTGLSSNDNYEFNGLNYDASDSKKINDLLKSLGDSILHDMDYDIQHDKFATILAPVLHVGGQYNLSKSLSFGLLSRTAFWKKAVRQSFNLSFCMQPYSFVSFNLGATYQVKGNAYLGGGFMFLMGPLQFYLLADYIPIYYSTLTINQERLGGDIPYFGGIPIPERQKSVTFRTGINLVFGRHGYTNKPMLDKGKSSWN